MVAQRVIRRGVAFLELGFRLVRGAKKPLRSKPTPLALSGATCSRALQLRNKLSKVFPAVRNVQHALVSKQLIISTANELHTSKQKEDKK
jgi:hypothetical protein